MAEALSDIQEEIEGLLRAGLADRFADPTVERIRELLPRLLDPKGSGALAVLTGLKRATGAAFGQSRRSFLAILDEEVLPAVAERVLAQAPTPGRDDRPGRGDLIASAELLVVLRKGLARIGQDARARAHIEMTGRRLLERTRAYAEQIGAGLEAGDHPDIAVLVRDLTRIEIIRWVLEALERPQEVAAVTSQFRAFSRQVLKRAGDVVARYIHQRDMKARYDTASVTVQVDDLVTLIEQVMDSEREAMAASADDPYAVALGAEVVLTFLRRMAALAGVVFEEIRESLMTAQGLDQASIEGRLKHLERLYHLCARLGAPEAGPAAREVIQEMRARVLEVARDGAGWLAQRLEARVPAKDLAPQVACIATLFAFSAKQGWAREADAIRETLKQRFGSALGL
ncbi:MAG: hypothetical protein OHK0024_23340 [Thalassobaculales bacterium]